MKKPLLLFFFAQLFIAFHINAQIIKQTSERVGLRAAPDIYSEIVVTIPAGTEIEVSRDYNKEWVPIEFNGKTVYLYSEYLVSAKSEPLRATTSSTAKSESQQENNGIYKNTRGERVRRPVKANTAPSGATAKCRDGTYSFSRSRRGTCSHHGGVQRWL